MTDESEIKIYYMTQWSVCLPFFLSIKWCKSESVSAQYLVKYLMESSQLNVKAENRNFTFCLENLFNSVWMLQYIDQIYISGVEN